MKIIDLLNKIANGEEVPKKIIAGSEECEYFYDSELKDYRNIKTNAKLFEDEIEKYIKYYLNDEVEIIEEEKKIPEKIPEEIIVGKKQPTHRIKKIEKKINEIISYLDYLKSKGE